MLANLTRSRSEERAGGMSWPDYLRLWENFGYNGVNYVVPSGGIGELTALQAQRDPIVLACITLRALVFSEIRFAFQQWESGRPGTLYGTEDLKILENPWPTGNTGDLLNRMEMDASLYGNSYWVREGNQLVRLDPNRVLIATAPIDGDELAHDGTTRPYAKRLIGYQVTDESNHPVQTFLPNEVAHYRPLPDPQHEFRGITWLHSLLPDVIADMDMTDFKHAFLKNAATPNLVVNFQPGVSEEAFNAFKDRMESSHTGPQTGFKTLYLGAGADVKVVGSNFQQLALDAVQSYGETRIAAAAGIPPAILGIAEGLKGSALNSGNFTSARRRLSDMTIRPLWRSAAACLETLLNVPGGSRLWYDDRDVPFLQEDVTDYAAIREQDAKTILTYVQAGYTPGSAIEAVHSGDVTRLVHTGLVSVQLQKPGPAIPMGGSEQVDPMLPEGTNDDAPQTQEGA